MRDLENLNTFQKTQINAILDQNKEKVKSEKLITDQLERYIVERVWLLEGYQIAKIIRKDSNEYMYATFVDFKSLHEFGMTFDHAVLICMARKYTVNTDAAEYAGRVLNAHFKPEYVE